MATLLMPMLFTVGHVQAQQTVTSPCPEVLIKQKYDHVTNLVYQRQGWDTVITCVNRRIELQSEPYIPVQYFNGHYKVEQVPYNPPDTTFARGTRMPINTDDDFAGSATNIPFPFYFFGIRKTGFVLGANGLVTFNTSAAGQGCPWSYSASIPWPNGTSGAPSALDRMRDAIYGVYEDTHPVSSYVTAPQGIYYGVLDTFPCRKIICSWNGVPEYPASSNQTNRCTYQIVCYEGSNIIEVHVFHRGVNTSWQNGVGLIGIQNATGEPQVRGEMGQSNMYVEPGAPAAYAPAGRNTFNTVLDRTSYRFTPQGRTTRSYEWVRIFDDDREDYVLTQNINDTNGYYIPMDDNDTLHPSLTRAVISPTVPSKYALNLRFRNANNDEYVLADTIVVGVDTNNDMSIKPKLEEPWPLNKKIYDICYGNRLLLNLDTVENVQPKTIKWEVTRILNGEKIIMPLSVYDTSVDNHYLTLKPDPGWDTLPQNKIDSLRIRVSVDFISGCTNFDTFLVRVFPNFDTFDLAAICDGDAFRWPLNGVTYYEPTSDPVVHLQSAPGCDSVVHLHLFVDNVSLTIDTVNDCRPVRWRNDKLYTATNTATAEQDTIILKNIYGCDSVIQLDLHIYPLTPRISSDVTELTLDNLNAQLTDASTGGGQRVWYLPSQNANGDSVIVQQTEQTVYYSIPPDFDSATIRLFVVSPYGCEDSTKLLLPFNKERFWMPNIFMPDTPGDNALFRSVSERTVLQDMYVYDRAGRLMYHGQGVDCAWDGRNLNGDPCPQGVYVWVIRYNNEFEPDKTIVKQGTITLLR